MISLPTDEKIIVFTRRHPITLILKLAFSCAFLLITIVFITLLASDFTNLNPNFTPFLLILTLFFILIYFLFSFIYFTNWYLDVWIITTKRIIDIEQISFFNSEFSEFMLDKVQDVTIDKKGFLANIFNYGDVQIQTAGMSRYFIFKQVPNPQKIKDYLMLCVQKKTIN